MSPSSPNPDEANHYSPAQTSRGEPSSAPDDLRPGDTYQDGPYLVFTAQYHLRRGFCCNSGCRHCPYK